ncbi:MAG TPA: histidine phosphatase family protein [Chloroflexota bacterium]|nr:histidine phosphatase family protein [Chloroflexota bacterium]
MTTLLVARHPETTWNVEERYQGRLESPLSERGRAQAALTAAHLAELGIAAIYASPLRRALELAVTVGATTGVPVRTDERLTEIAQTPWEGLTRTEIEQCFPELFRTWRERPDRVRFQYGESVQDVMLRTSSMLRELYDRHDGDTVLLVTHSVAVQTIAAWSLNLELRYLHRVAASNASITTFRGTTAPGYLVSLNVTEHLADASVGASTIESLSVVRKRKAS